MKRSCKNIDITDVATIKPFVADCCRRHYSRHDFRKLLMSVGMDKESYEICTATYNKQMLEPYIDRISEICAEKIKDRNLNLESVTIREMMDKTTGKIRLIGRESAMQQIYDYIAVYSSMEIFNRRLVMEQCSSIPNRGQVYGKNLIKRWIDTDNRSARFAEKHSQEYSRTCRYFAKLDIEKCYPSADYRIFMGLFRKDCGNQDIVWLWETLLSSHHVDGYQGFMIGALVSQWAAQYMLSFAYRFAKSHYSMRRGKRIATVKHMLLFMDDMLLTGSNRNRLKKAIEQLTVYVKDKLGWEITPNWHIRELDKFDIDMMGYVIHADGSVTIRERNFLKLRRMALKHDYTIKQARRIMSFKGFCDHSDSRKLIEKYQLNDCFKDARSTIRRYEEKHSGEITASGLSTS